MCGIVGMLDPGASRDAEETCAVARRMADRMVHRGPDDEGYWADADRGVCFGHRRLSVIDLSAAGHQPMTSTSGRTTITYNGEIYNHDELADDLQRHGTRFRGHSDTEVLVEAIDVWGLEGTLERVDGMFAFGVWDHECRRLTIARDRLGEKPLFHTARPSGPFVFASSLDALVAHPDVEADIDPDALALYLRYKYVPAPWSIYRGVRKLEPGHTLTVDERGKAGDPRPYWSLLDLASRAPSFDGTPDDAVEELDRLLGIATRRRMVADVPVGVFLSGGVDSSTIASIAAEQSTDPIRTFTIGSDDTDYDESSHARDVADHLGAEHTELIVDESRALAAVDGISAHHDEPFADSSQIPTQLVSALARHDVTVALSGDAGDELFGGYNRYTWVPGIWRQLARMPIGLRRPAARLGRKVPPAAWTGAARLVPPSRRPQQVALKVSKVLGIADATSDTDVFNRLCSHWADPSRLVPGADEPLDLHRDAARWPSTGGIVEHMMAVDAVTFLPDDILAKVDRAAMSVSLETRIPLLDRQIVELAVSLPTSMKIRDGITKWPLRKVLDRHVPARLIDRPKSGFGLPIEEWLRGPLREWAHERLVGSLASPMIDRAAVRPVWEEHLSGRANRAYELWDVAIFSDWLDHRTLGDTRRGSSS